MKNHFLETINKYNISIIINKYKEDILEEDFIKLINEKYLIVDKRNIKTTDNELLESLMKEL